MPTPRMTLSIFCAGQRRSTELRRRSVRGGWIAIGVGFGAGAVIGSLISFSSVALGAFTGHDVDAVVRNGAVNVDAAESSSAPNSSVETRTLEAGQVAVIDNGSVQVENRDRASIESSLSWAGGLIYLHGPLLQAVTQLNEYNERQLVLADPAIANLQVAGLYDRGEPQQFADSLHTRGVRYKVERALESGQDLVVLFGEH